MNNHSYKYYLCNYVYAIQIVMLYVYMCIHSLCNITPCYTKFKFYHILGHIRIFTITAYFPFIYICICVHTFGLHDIRIFEYITPFKLLSKFSNPIFGSWPRITNNLKWNTHLSPKEGCKSGKANWDWGEELGDAAKRTTFDRHWTRGPTSRLTEANISFIIFHLNGWTQWTMSIFLTGQTSWIFKAHIP